MILRALRRSLCASAAASAAAFCLPLPARADAPQKNTQVSDGLTLQAGRAKGLKGGRGKVAAYTKRWDLSGLPQYHPEQQASGKIRMWGQNYLTDGNLAEYWEKDFQKFEPGVSFEYRLKSALAAMPGLVMGVADIGPDHHISFGELLLFERYKNYDPLEIVMSTGSFDVGGWQPAFGVLVHNDNPVKGLSMKQLDGIYGSERRGGWVGTSWHPEFARGPEGNIRTWGQVGDTGEWADKRIRPYGLNQRYHQAMEISDMLLHGSDKWNEELQIYANEILPNGQFSRLLTDDLKADRYGIGYAGAASKGLDPALRIVPIAPGDGSDYVGYTLDNVQSRTYPLHDDVYFYIDRKPGTPLDPKVREYVRFVLSREGQEDVERDGKYTPLTAEVALAMLKKLN